MTSASAVRSGCRGGAGSLPLTRSIVWPSSRSLGNWVAGGDWIAQQVAETLGYQYIDRYLVEKIANLTDTFPEEVEPYDEKGEGRIQHFLKCLLVPEMGPGGCPLPAVPYFPEFGMGIPYVMEHDADQEVLYLDRGTYQLLLTTLILDLGAVGKAVIVGRASQVILAHHSEAIHVKVVAPVEMRCERLRQSRNLDLERARKLVEQHDRWRKHYLRNYYHVDWDDPLLYHLTLNTGRMKQEDAVSLVVRGVSQAPRKVLPVRGGIG